MNAADVYLMHSMRVALQAAKETDARPKPIVLPEPPPERSFENYTFASTAVH
jgi:hypothetical protein